MFAQLPCGISKIACLLWVEGLGDVLQVFVFKLVEDGHDHHGGQRLGGFGEQRIGSKHHR